jgi:hypothetical protein
VLVVAPAARLLTLWPELLANLAAFSGESVLPADHEPGRYELLLPSGHVLALRSWREMLGELDGRLRAAGLNDWLADLAQLRRLTERMESARLPAAATPRPRHAHSAPDQEPVPARQASGR